MKSLDEAVWLQGQHAGQVTHGAGLCSRLLSSQARGKMFRALVASTSGTPVKMRAQSMPRRKLATCIAEEVCITCPLLNGLQRCKQGATKWQSD